MHHMAGTKLNAVSFRAHAQLKQNVVQVLSFETGELSIVVMLLRAMYSMSRVT